MNTTPTATAATVVVRRASALYRRTGATIWTIGPRLLPILLAVALLGLAVLTIVGFLTGTGPELAGATPDMTTPADCAACPPLAPVRPIPPASDCVMFCTPAPAAEAPRVDLIAAAFDFAGQHDPMLLS
ncbi:hypothetical protein [Nocardia sp. NPDC051750]|uniref:hypothetical protein n=1 Tax=Nocardia sp. NPDC051750 TaxID=3364325 RepID=UPI0037B02D29